MTRTGFVIANLWRKKTRTVLTLLSIVTAFLLFGLLQSVNVLFSAGADFVGATRLVTQARVSFTQSLPMRLLSVMPASIRRLKIGSAWSDARSGEAARNCPFSARS